MRRDSVMADGQPRAVAVSLFSSSFGAPAPWSLWHHIMDQGSPFRFRIHSDAIGCHQFGLSLSVTIPRSFQQLAAEFLFFFLCQIHMPLRMAFELFHDSSFHQIVVHPTQWVLVTQAHLQHPRSGNLCNMKDREPIAGHTMLMVGRMPRGTCRYGDIGIGRMAPQSVRAPFG